MSSMSSCLSVCQFVHHFLAYSGILGPFKVSISSMKMALVIKLTFLRPPFKSDHLEAQKKPVFQSLKCELNFAFSANDQCQFNNLHIFSYDDHYRSVLDCSCCESSLDLQSS